MYVHFGFEWKAVKLWYIRYDEVNWNNSVPCGYKQIKKHLDSVYDDLSPSYFICKKVVKMFPFGTRNPSVN